MMLADAIPSLLSAISGFGAREFGLLCNSLLLAAGTTAISLPLGAAIAFLLTRTDLPGRRAMTLALAALLFVPLYLQGGAWMAGFGVTGWWTAIQPAGWPVLLVGWRGAIWVHAMAAVPWVALFVGLGLRAAPPELEEETLLVGSRAQVFWHATWRYAWPAAGVAGLWVALGIATEMSITDLFAVRTYAEELYTKAVVGENTAPLSVLPGTALAVAIALAVLGGLRRITPTFSPAPRRDRLVFLLGSWRWPLTVVTTLAVAWCVGVPLASLAWKAGVEVSDTPTGLARSWSLVKFLSMVATSPWRCRAELGWSLLISGVTATAALLAATPLAWWACNKPRRTTLLLTAVAMFLALPGPTVGLGLIDLLNRPDSPALIWLYDRSILAPCTAQWVRAVPWAILIAWFALRSVPQDLLDAAAIDGAGPWATLLRIVVPQRRAGLAAAWLAAFLVAMNDLAASILVVPPGVTTLSIHIFGLLHYGVEDQVSGISLAQVIITLALGALTAKLARRSTP